MKFVSDLQLGNGIVGVEGQSLFAQSRLSTPSWPAALHWHSDSEA